jgi:DNA-binding Lrp family transcriptional regulator
MSKSERHARILSILGESDELSIHELTRRLGRVSSVTVRRDVTELAAEGALHRTHGTVSKPDSQTATHAATVGDSQDQIGDVDAIILPPIEGRGADTLRGMARRRKILFLAESAAQKAASIWGPTISRSDASSAIGRAGRLRDCAALFPEIVGLLAIDFLAKALAGEAMPAEIRTPHAILTPQNIARFYRREPNGWSLIREAESELISAPPAVLVDGRRRTIGFVPHYPAHDWYRNMARAMRQPDFKGE